MNKGLPSIACVNAPTLIEMQPRQHTHSSGLGVWTMARTARMALIPFIMPAVWNVTMKPI